MKKFNKNDVGCVFDGVRRIYIGKSIQQLAIDYNWNEKPELNPEHEEYWDATDSAIEYLNENCCQENVMFGMNEGDFFLNLIEDL